MLIYLIYYYTLLLFLSELANVALHSKSRCIRAIFFHICVLSHFLALNRRDHFPRVLYISEFQIPYSLPRPCIQPPIRNRNCYTCANKR